jgi:hypothetical protein
MLQVLILKSLRAVKQRNAVCFVSVANRRLRPKACFGNQKRQSGDWRSGPRGTLLPKEHSTLVAIFVKSLEMPTAVTGTVRDAHLWLFRLYQIFFS